MPAGRVEITAADDARLEAFVGAAFRAELVAGSAGFARPFLAARFEAVGALPVVDEAFVPVAFSTVEFCTADFLAGGLVAADFLAGDFLAGDAGAG